MSQAASAEHYLDPNTLADTQTRVSNWKMFMWLFLAQDAMMFFTMFAAYLGLRISSSDWYTAYTDVATMRSPLGIPKTAVMTFILICSSVTMVQGLAAIQRGDRKKLKMWLGLTVLGGVLFLLGQVTEYTELLTEPVISLANGSGIPMSIRRHPFDATFFILTSFHGLHVFCGVVYLLSILLKSHRYSAENYTHIEIAGLYWHFVDLVWIILFTLVYLI
jgi:heme/copper-type cytochrome/quinol oxidase subunit 3